MKKTQIKLIAMIFLSLISFMTSLSIKAQTWSGWEVIDPNGTTNASMCVPEGLLNVVLTKGINVQKIYFNTLRNAIPNGWTGPQEMPGNLETDVSVDAVRASNYNSSDYELYIFAKGLDRNIYYKMGAYNPGNQTLDWKNGWEEIAGRQTNFAPSVTFPNDLSRVADNFYLFAQGNDDNKVYINVYNGLKWQGWSLVPGDQTTNASLESLHDYDGSKYMRVYLFAKGVDSKIYYNTYHYDLYKKSDFTINIGNWGVWREIPGNFTTGYSVSAMVSDHKIYLFAVNSSDKKIYFSTSTIPSDNIVRRTPQDWSDWIEVPGNFQTDAAVSVANLGLGGSNKLDIYAKGLDGRIYRNFEK